MRSSFLAADIVLIPTEASQLDIETLEITVAVLKETEELNESRIAKTIINKAPTHYGANDYKEAKGFIAESFGDYIEPLDQIVRYRSVYKKSFVPGYGVVEMGDPKAKAEIQLLAKEISELTSKSEEVA
jgi:chromosome partitioning protein